MRFLLPRIPKGPDLEIRTLEKYIDERLFSHAQQDRCQYCTRGSRCNNAPVRTVYIMARRWWHRSPLHNNHLAGCRAHWHWTQRRSHAVHPSAMVAIHLMPSVPLYPEFLPELLVPVVMAIKALGIHTHRTEHHHCYDSYNHLFHNRNI